MKINFRYLATLILAILPNITKAEFIDFNSEVYNNLVKENKTYVLDFSAAWCPTCVKQEKVVKYLLKDPIFKELHFIKVDFDTSMELRKSLGVNKQSTLVIIKDKKEIARSVGETNAEQIREFFDLALE